MPSTYTTGLRLVKPATGELNTTWGSVFNSQFSDLIDTAIAGYTDVALSDADKTLTATNGTADEARSMVLNFTGALTAARNIVVPVTTKLYFVRNSTTGGYGLTVKTTSGSGISVPASGSIVLACDGTNVVSVVTALASGATVGGYSVGYLDIPQNSQSADYTLVLTDAGKHIFHPAADTTARAWTIPANASVAFPIGTTITFINDTGAGAITLSITSDTLTLAGTGSTGSRSLTAPATATAVKVTSTRWIVSGQGIS
jgi:hypothetical protein